MRESILEKFDYLLFLCVFILVFMGIAFIYSSGVNSSGVLMTNEHIKQIIWRIIGLVFLVFFALLNFRKFERNSLYMYLFLIFIYILQLHCTNFQRKSEQVDESACIMMIIEITCCKACK